MFRILDDLKKKAHRNNLFTQNTINSLNENNRKYGEDINLNKDKIKNNPIIFAYGL